ncbi:MAG: glycosyltransferase family 2 protein [Candidatus Diapherotrites archaeon]|nr:glycosyltransferase family 2 protein [Candidatus Diapherotrites archaeon]
MKRKKTDEKMLNASIIVATHNRAHTLRKTLRAMLDLYYPAKYEIIVVNDGSKDETKEMLKNEFLGNNKITIINFDKNQGVCRARNAGIKAAKYEIVVVMDDDCIPNKSWLTDLVSGFTDEKIGIVSSYGYYGGTSTAFRKDLVLKVGGYDEEYRFHREDTDLSFKIMELGYEFKLVKANFLHDHKEEKPKGLIGLLRYGYKRLKLHGNDVLLYKKHPNELTRKFLHIKFGFIVSPLFDFKVATGLWKHGGRLELSSPRGLVFIENKTPLHALAIIFLGICWVIALKFARLTASIRFRKLLI